MKHSLVLSGLIVVACIFSAVAGHQVNWWPTHQPRNTFTVVIDDEEMPGLCVSANKPDTALLYVGTDREVHVKRYK